MQSLISVHSYRQVTDVVNVVIWFANIADIELQHTVTLALAMPWKC